MADNATVARRSLRAVWHPCTQMKLHQRLPLIPIKRGQGVWLYDFDGRRYLDAISSWWVNLFGHGNSRIDAAVKAQLDGFAHVMLAGLTHEPVVRLSERLGELAPDGLGHCFYASDGASAVEIALKMSAHAWRNAGRGAKTRFICLQNGYHGETLGALAVCDVALFREAYGSLLRPAAVLPSPDWRRAELGESARDFAVRCASALEAYLERHAGETAALILEPVVQGAAGMAMYDPEYLRLARQMCDDFEVHLIADEIAVGMGRTGTFFACEQAGISPDFLCLSKGITGGYLPLSVVLTREAIYRAFYDDDARRGFLHSHSYAGNALACAAALATLDIFSTDNVLAANRRTAEFVNAAAARLAEHPLVANFRNTGMIWAFEVLTRDPGFAGWCFEAALQRELLLRPIGNTVYFMPPYIITPDELEGLLTRVLGILEQYCVQHDQRSPGAALLG